MNNYGKLIQRVKKVNNQAALIMAKQIPLLAARGLMIKSDMRRGETLCSSIIWSNTRQGHEYWKKLDRKVG